MPGQRRVREAERAARLAAVERARELRAAGSPASQVADLFGVTSRTVLRWTTLAANGALSTKAIGRPAKRASREARAALLRYLSLRPRQGVPTLRQRHPELGIREAQELAARLRSVRTTRTRDVVEALTWHLPGSVWAVDFTDAGLEVEGTYRHLLLVRDLATGYTLLSLPCESQNAPVVQAAFEVLFARHGAPLVLKADNGSGFIADATRDLLACHDVLLLRSPPGTPAYNGSCEAGVGSIKTRAHHIATAHGRVTRWSCDDVEAARLEANHAPGPRVGDPTAAQRWSARAALPTAARRPRRRRARSRRRRARRAGPARGRGRGPRRPGSRARCHRWQPACALATLQPTRVHPRASRTTSVRSANGSVGGGDFLYLSPGERRTTFRQGHSGHEGRLTGGARGARVLQ